MKDMSSEFVAFSILIFQPFYCAAFFVIVLAVDLTE